MFSSILIREGYAMACLLRPLFYSALTAFGLFVEMTELSAQGVDIRAADGPWSIYCIKDKVAPQPQDCSVITSAAAAEDQSMWVKVAFTFETLPTQLNMTIRTPRLNYFSGISISTNLRQFGKVFIEKCGDSYCQTGSVRVDPILLSGLATADMAKFEYQTSDQEGISLTIDVQDLIPIVGKLAQILKIPDEQWKPEDHTVLVVMKSSPSVVDVNGADTHSKDCHGWPAETSVTVSANLDIEDEEKFEAWLDNSALCATKPVFWVYGDSSAPSTPLGDASTHTVFQRVLEKVPMAVVSDPSGHIPLQYVDPEPPRHGPKRR
jgi:hypothetical protein